MKRIFLISVLLFGSLVSGAQRFYYLETNNVLDQQLKKGLEKYAQHVVPSVLAADYIVRTKIGPGETPDSLNLGIILEDSVSHEPLLETTMCYRFGVIRTKAEMVYRMAIQSFLARRIDEVILSANGNYNGYRSGLQKARKDHT